MYSIIKSNGSLRFIIYQSPSNSPEIVIKQCQDQLLVLLYQLQWEFLEMNMNDSSSNEIGQSVLV